MTASRQFRKAIILGDSHTVSLRHAARDGGPAKSLPSLRIGKIGPSRVSRTPFFERSAAGVRFNDAGYRSKFEKLTGLQAIAPAENLIWGFSLGFYPGNFVSGAVWNEYAPAELGLRDRHALSGSVVVEGARHSFRFILSFFECLRDLGADFFVVSAPPLRHDHPSMHGTPEQKAICLAADRLYRETFRAELDKRGVAYVLPPKSVENEEGALLPEFCRESEDDRLHANTRFGAIMLSRVAEHIADRSG